MILANRETSDNLIFSDLYIASGDPSNFELLLANVVVSSNKGVPAVQVVTSMPGMMLANVYEEDYIKVHEGLAYTKAAIGSTDLNQFIKTMVSYDYGKTWGRLQPPSLTAQGTLFRCAEQHCYLNLHLADNDKIPAVMGHESAPGLILANGNVGVFLSHMESDMGFFVSSDGGITWTQSSSGGATIYQIAEQGNLLLACTFGNLVSSAVYSTDYGTTWKPAQQKLQTDTFKPPMYVISIYAEKTREAPYFVVIGRSPDDTTMISTIDFAYLHNRECTGSEAPNSAGSDFVTWVPHVLRDGRCFDGRTGFYLRRRPTGACYFNSLLDKFRQEVTCPCTEEDFECDMGYSKQEGPQRCEPTKNFDTAQLVPAHCEDTYLVGDGYRKLSTSHCQGGVDHPRTPRKCPGKWGFLGGLLHYLGRMFAIGIGILLLFVLGKFIYQKYSGDPYLTVSQSNKKNELSKDENRSVYGNNSGERKRIKDDEFDDDDEI